MYIKLTIADFEEMDANTLLGLHNKILESRDDVILERNTARAETTSARKDVQALKDRLYRAENKITRRNRALAVYAMSEILGDDDEL
tara:strand:+ start:6849 stop:7109 length:261 start_codon:yes stop_codon:yes gene_type:complete